MGGERGRTWGTHFGETNDPASMVVSPVLARRVIRSSLVASEMGRFSFWRPSRGPTSTSLTRRSGDEVGACSCCGGCWGWSAEVANEARVVQRGRQLVARVVAHDGRAAAAAMRRESSANLAMVVVWWSAHQLEKERSWRRWWVCRVLGWAVGGCG